ncbi:hypothetical protein H632_c3706p0, partial [Helicosporidium sp. ATCC 50920]
MDALCVWSAAGSIADSACISVLSVTMDAWNPDQLKKMKAGGNGRMNAFLTKYGVPKLTDIVEKYNSKAAEYYRELLKAE